MAYFRTTFTIEVLSEEPIGECLSLSQIDYAISEGDCVGGSLNSVETEITAEEMAKALIAFGSEPGFFQLDEAGKKLEN